jgi:flagellar hook-associated protein 1 FlgK
MSLSVAFNNARTSLLTTAKQISVSGRNLAGATDPDYTRKTALQATGFDGASHIVGVARSTNLALFYRVIGSQSSAAGQEAILAGLEELQQTVGDTADGTSPAALFGEVLSALQTLADSPSDRSLTQAAVTAAGNLAGALSDASRTVLAVRDGADAAIAASVDTVNDLLARFAALNTEVVHGTVNGDDVTEALDKRDAVLAQLSEEVGVTVVMRADNDIALYADGGVTLFDRTPRSVAFAASTSLPPGTAGNAVLIDGVPVTGGSATMPLRSGRLAGLATLRDEIAPTYQAQLDEIARALVGAFAETDQTGGGGPALAGLFTWSGGPAVPAGAVAGLAATLDVNPLVDPSAGGNLALLRDGGINGAAYSYNATGAASFADRLVSILAELEGARSFDAAAGLGTGVSLLDFGTASVGWLEDLRSSTSQSADYQNTLLARASEALSNATGVNVDDEYALQLQLEQSYAASSKLIAALQQLFDTLLEAVA